MLKSTLIARISDKMTNLSERKVSESINLIIDLMTKALQNGQRIEIRNFGSFSLHHRPPRKAHNPKTGERVMTVSKYTPHFKPGKDLKDRVAASRLTTPIKD